LQIFFTKEGIAMPRTKGYNTKARQEILDYLKKCWASTVSAAEILQHLKDNGMSVNPTTVYRYLDKLCSDHIIIKYATVKGKKSVYQLSGPGQHCSEHLHLKCVRCGRIIHLDCGFMDELKNHLQGQHNFQLQCEGNMLYGVCNDCSSSNND
jgi:Fur family ferric uptake transcriptional regulator